MRLAGFVALFGLLAACLPVGAERVPFGMDASNQAGWWKPIDEFGGSVYVAYDAWGGAGLGGPRDRHTVYVARRSPSGTWTRGCLPAAGGGCALFMDDPGHRQPTIAVDGDGYIHVFADMHLTGWIYYRSSRPGDPTSMVNRASQMPDLGDPFTYPNATRTPNGDVYLVIRDFADGRLYRWNDAANAWTRVAIFADQAQWFVYPDDIAPDASGNLHIAWEWAFGDGGLRHLGSYVRYEPATGRFFDAAGQRLATPIQTTSTAVYQALVPGERATDNTAPSNPPGLQTAKLALDPATGRPMAAYRMRMTAGGRFQATSPGGTARPGGARRSTRAATRPTPRSTSRSTGASPACTTPRPGSPVPTRRSPRSARPTAGGSRTHPYSPACASSASRWCGATPSTGSTWPRPPRRRSTSAASRSASHRARLYLHM